MGRGWGVVAEQGSVNSPVERGEGSVYTRKPLRGTCVCVCVCVRERERERARSSVQPARAPLPGVWLLAFLGPPSFPGLWVRTRQPSLALPTSSVCPGGLVTAARVGVWLALALPRGLVVAAPELVLRSVEMPSRSPGSGEEPSLRFTHRPPSTCSWSQLSPREHQLPELPILPEPFASRVALRCLGSSLSPSFCLWTVEMAP